MSITQPRTIIYKTSDQNHISLDLYLPGNPRNVPILLWFHGGGLLQGRRSTVAPHMVRAISKHNIAVISPDYRLAPQVGIAEIFDDVKDVVTYIRDGRLAEEVGKDVLDTSRLAVSGSSAGGYLAFLSGLYLEPKPKVILPIYPIADPLGTFFTTPQPHPFGGPPPNRDTLAPYIDPNSTIMTSTPAEHERNELYFYMLQECNYASLLGMKAGDSIWRVARNVYERRLPPAYVVHGDADTAVGVEQSDEVVGVMVGCGLPVQYERLHGVQHLFDRDESVGLEKMYEFMMEYL
ncbi:hypothetical protein M433DRAFT_433578 [Acidomyces richmondensis BFW]|nr:MAG: hypothetical protein FE78DRAFT_138095 [Acidomyces sp. 'richmondensis']KYG42094.1 hypothetical protein M433DRAFT_433578 [Acidomyces richmondensis BFW]